MTIWDKAFIRAGQNGTTVEIELSRMAKRGAKARRRSRLEPKSRYASDWARDASNVRLPYSD